MDASALRLREALQLLPHSANLHRIAKVLHSDPASIVCHTAAELPAWMRDASGAVTSMQVIESVAQAAAVGRILASSVAGAVVAKRGAVLRVKNFTLLTTLAIPPVLEITARWGAEFNGAFEVQAEIRLPGKSELLASGQLTMREFDE